MATEDPYVCDVDLQVEIEEREEQLYETDGKTPIMNTHSAGEIMANTAVKTKVKVKRYFYRLAATVTTTWLDVLANAASSIQMGGKIKNTNQGTVFHVTGDTGVKYICTGERATLVNPILRLWRHFETWHGFSPWYKVPSYWGLQQTTEVVEDSTQQDQG